MSNEAKHESVDQEEQNDDYKTHVYIGSLAPSVNDESLKSLFAPFGNVVAVKIGVKQQNTPGYGFVHFDNVDSANKAVAALNDTMFANKQIKVSIAKRKDQNRIQTNLYVAGLPTGFTNEQLYKIFSAHGQIRDYRVLQNNANNNTENHGVGFVRYENQKQATAAIQALNGKKVSETGIPITVKFARDNKKQGQFYPRQGFRPPVHMNPRYMYGMQYAQPRYPQPDYSMYMFPHQYAATSPSQPRAKTNLYVAGLPSNYSKNELDTLFLKYGRIIGSRVLLNQTGNSRGIAFVRYENPKSAQDAINALNNQTPQGFVQPITVKFANEPNNRRFYQPRRSPMQNDGQRGLNSYQQGQHGYDMSQRYQMNGGNGLNQGNLQANVRQPFQQPQQVASFQQGQQGQYSPISAQTPLSYQQPYQQVGQYPNDYSAQQNKWMQ